MRASRIPALVVPTLAFTPTLAFVVLAFAFALGDPTHADARPRPFEPPDPLEDLLEESRLSRFDDPVPFTRREPDPKTPRIIDLNRMHAEDCQLDQFHGGDCILRFEVDSLDVDYYGRNRALSFRYELLEQILDTAEVIDAL
jgi:hypothetical protein